MLTDCSFYPTVSKSQDEDRTHIVWPVKKFWNSALVFRDTMLTSATGGNVASVYVWCVLATVCASVSYCCSVHSSADNKNVSACFCVASNIYCRDIHEIPRFYQYNDVTWTGVYVPSQNISSVPQTALFHIRSKKVVLNNNPIGDRLDRHALTGKLPSDQRNTFEILVHDCLVLCQSFAKRVAAL